MTPRLLKVEYIRKDGIIVQGTTWRVTPEGNLVIMMADGVTEAPAGHLELTIAPFSSDTFTPPAQKTEAVKPVEEKSDNLPETREDFWKELGI